MKSIDKKLIEIYESINVDELEANSESMQSVKKAIEYLKNYAKMQAASKLLSDEQGLKNDIEKAKAEFEAMIEQKKKEKSNLPKTKRLRKNCTENERKEHAEEIEKKRNDAKRIEQDIKIYKDKVKVLNTYLKTLRTPSKVMKTFFQEEQLNSNEKLSELVDVCVQSIMDGLSKDDIVGEDKVFREDNGKYKVNYNNARSFLSAIQSKDDLTQAAEYVEANADYQETRKKYKAAIKNKRKCEHVEELAGTEQFEWISDNVNTIAKIYKELKEREEKFNKDTVFSRIAGGARDILGIREKTPRRILALREQLYLYVNNFTADVRRDAELIEAFDAYKMIRENMKDGANVDLEELECLATMTQFRSTGEIQFSISTAKIEDIQAEAKYLKENSIRIVNGLCNRKLEKQEAVEELHKKLSKKAKKIAEMHTSGKGNIVAYANKYSKTELPATVPVTVLQSIIGRKNIPLEEILESYASILGDGNDERVDTMQIVQHKVDTIRQQIRGLSVEQEDDKNIEKEQNSQEFEIAI